MRPVELDKDNFKLTYRIMVQIYRIMLSIQRGTIDALSLIIITRYRVGCRARGLALALAQYDK
jgi:hypothetical protein